MITLEFRPPELLTRLLAEAAEESDDRERGGFLLGRWYGQKVVICELLAADAENRGDDYIYLDFAEARAASAANFPLRIVGDFHSHPRTPDGSSGERDRAAWSQKLAAAGGYHWIGLVLSQTPDPDHPWTLTGWAVDRVSAPQPVGIEQKGNLELLTPPFNGQFTTRSNTNYG